MAIFRPNLNTPIPNNPFYSAQTNALQSATGPLIVGSGISVNYTTGTISATGGGGGGGSGTVTVVNTGAGLTGGPITSTGTISLETSPVTPGTYTFATFTVDGTGRVTAASSGVTPVSSVSGLAPITVTGTSARIVSIAAASTTAAGAVQLFDGLNSTSTALALTAAQGYSLQQQLSSLLVATNLTLAGTFDATSGLMLSATSDGVTAGFVTGSPLPAPAASNTDFFVIITTPGTYNPPGPSGPFTITSGDWLLSTGTQWDLLDIGPTPTYATTTAAGTVCLSTNALAQAGTDTNTALTPAAARSAFVPNVCFPTKGDLVAGTSVANTPVTVPVGFSGQILTVDSTAPTGFMWKSPASSGTVTSIATGPGLSGGPITTAGTIALTNTAVTAGSYANPTLTVDAQGRITAATAGSPPLTALTGTAPIAVTAGTTPVVSVACSSTTALGVVQLTDALNNTSQTLAITAFAGKCLQDQISALALTGTVELAGTIDASTGLVVSVTTVGTASGYTVGGILPAASVTTLNSYVIATTSGTMAPPGGPSVSVTKGDWFLVSEVSPGTYAWEFLNVGFDAVPATTTTAGIVCLSTNALALAGSDATTALTPAAACCAYIQRSTLTAKGDLVAGTAACTPGSLTVGTDGQVLVACAAAATGLCWITATGSPATPTVRGTVFGCTDGSNAGLGCNVLLANTSGTGNVAIGLASLRSNTTGVNNVAIGNAASCSNTVGSGNVAIGTVALGRIVDASRTVAIGENAMAIQTTGQYNVALGWAALCSASTGGSNVALGALAGNNITSGSSNVVIGPNVTVPFGNQDTQLAIGFNAGQCWLTGDSDKNVKFWAGIRANDNGLGSAGQGLLSTGTGVAWGATGTQPWISVGAMGGLGAPVFLTTSNSGNTTTTGGYNGVWKQQVGPKTWNVIYQYRASGASVGFSNGDADFVFQLPAGLSFDTDIPFQNTFGGSVRTSSHANRKYFLPGASSTQFNAGSGTGSENGSGVIIWSGNQFRFMITTGSDGGPRAWGTNYWNNNDIGINIGFQFQTP